MRLGVLLEQGGSVASMRRAGQEARLRYYLSRYREAFEAVLFFSYEREDPAEWEQEISVRILPRRGLLGGTVYSLALPFLRKRDLAGCDLIRVLQMSAALPAATTRWLYRVPYAVTFGYDLLSLSRRRGAIHLIIARLNLWLASRTAAAIFYATPLLRNELEKLSPKGRLVHLPNGVDLSLFRFAPLRITPAPGPTWRVISVGRLSPEKNYASLIEALRRMASVELHLVGSGPEASRLEALARHSNVRLILHGTVPQADLPHLLETSDLFVLPSRTEGHPKALLEAMACGLPCVGSSEAAGIREILQDGDNGLLVEGSPESLQKGIDRLLTDRGLGARLAANARRDIEQNFDLEKILAREIETLRALATTGHV